MIDDKHVKKKKPRISSSQKTARPVIDDATQANISMVMEEEEDAGSIDVNYAHFESEDLVQMVSGVGVDPRGMDKTKLIKNCKIYQDLSESVMLSFLSIYD